jgi:hypothetical protein
MAPTTPDARPLRRYGDRNAVKFRVRPWLVVVVIAVFGFGIAAGIRLLIHDLESRPRLAVGDELGITLGVLIVIGCGVAWTIYWAPLRRAVRLVTARHPESLVLGARIPALDPAIVTESWPSTWGPAIPPRRLVVRVDRAGVELLSATAPVETFLQLTWEQVTGFDPVEYVEARVAYDGLAIDAEPEGAAVVVQLVTLSPIARFPRGRALAAIAVRAERFRPPTGET